MSEGKIGGLAKRVRAALLTQTGLRLKVKLRGEDGEDIDGEEEAEEAGTGMPAAPGARAAEAGATGTTRRPAPPGGPASAEQMAYVQRLRKVRDAVDAALKAQHPESTKLRALMGFASEKAAAGNHAAALQALDALDKLLAGAEAAAAEPAGLPAWQAARNDAVESVKAIAKEIAAARHAESAAALVQLKAVVSQLTPRPTSLQQVAELERYLGQDEVVAEICEFASDIRTPLLGALARLKRTLEGIA
jgi:hypothetical protein